MKKVIYSLATAAIALGMTACGGKKTDKAELEETATFEFDTTDSDTSTYTEASEDETYDTNFSGAEYTCKPAANAIEGPLSDYITVVDKTYKLELESGLGEEYYVLTPDFDVNEAKKLDGTIDIYASFYDEDGNLVEFPSEGGTTSKFSSFSNGFLQMALKDGKDCNRTSVLIRPEHIKDFTPDMLNKIKTFKIFSQIDNDEFSYDPDIWN